MLLAAIDEHRGAFEYDWRTRFGVALDSLPESMDWAEAYRLMAELCRDPASHVFVALTGWQRPTTDAALVLADLFDMQKSSKSKRRPKPYPRPWDKPRVQHGGDHAVTVEEWKRMKAERTVG